MTSLIVSDLHAHAWTRFSTTLPDGTNSRFQHLLDALDQVRHMVEHFQPDNVIILGDITHRRYFVNFSVYNRLMARLSMLRGDRDRRSGFLLVGNHDYESHGVHSLTPFRFAGWNVIDKPTWTQEGYFVPWMPDDGVPQAVAVPLPGSLKGKARIFLHYALDGTPLDSEFALPSTLKLEMLNDFEKIVLGHVHTPSQTTDGRVTYVGAPLHFDFGDAGDRFCWMMDDDGDLTAHEIKAPKFITTKYPKVPMPSEPGFLRVLGAPRDLIGDVREKAVKLGWLDAAVVEVEVPSEAVKALTAGVMLDADVMKSYVERKYPDLEDDARAAILKYGLDCLGEAK